MGRAKLKMEALTSETKRNLAFKNKKATMIKRMHELTVLCDAKACMITYYGSKKEPQVWPENLDEVRGLIEAYKNKDQSGRNKTYGLSEFFKDRKRKVEHDIAKVRKEILGAKYPTWHESFDQFTGEELSGLGQVLSDKAALVKSRVDQLKRSGVAERFMGHGQGMELMNYGDPRIDWGLANRGQQGELMNYGDPRIDWGLVNHQQGIPFQPNMFVPPYGFYPVPCDQNGMSYVNQNPMMTMLMQGTNDGDEFGNAFMGSVNMPMPLQTYVPQPPRQQQFPPEENYYGRQEDNFRY